MKTSTIRKLTSMLATFVLAVVAMSSIGCGSDSGGSSGTGGRSGGTGGSNAGTGGAAVVHLVNYTFDTGVQGWALGTYADPNSVNLAGNYPADGGTDAGAAATPPTLEYDGTVGDGGGGSLKITVTFTAYGQYVDPGINFTTPLDLTGKTLHAKLEIGSVSTGNFMGGGQLHVVTGANFAYGSAPVLLPTTTGVFSTSSFPLAGAVGIDPTMVVGIGVQIFSGMTPAAGPLPAPQTIVFYLDTVTD